MSKQFTLKELSDLTGAELFGDPNHTVTYVNSLESATASEVSFLANPRYQDLLKLTAAGVICIDAGTPLIEGKNFLVSSSPSKTFQMIVEAILVASSSGFSKVHPSAVLHETAIYGKDVLIGPHVTIDQNVKIGNGTKIYGNVYIGSDVQIGDNCVIYPGAIVRERSILHNRVILQPGAVIGSCGFGYITDKQGNHQKIDQLGHVVLEDDVEIGANTTIDRARFKHTYISKGTKIDNLVQIGHNVVLGKHNIIVSQTGISGSSKTGDYVVMGGQSGVVGHVEIADHIQIATRGGVTKNLTEKGQYGGNPIQTLREFNRQRVYLHNIEKYVKKIETLENELRELKKLISQKTS